MNENKLPILYTFRRCPYAIRARMAICIAEIPVELREVVLKDKPKELLIISPKATVPVLQLNETEVIDESLDIMKWALGINDPLNLMKKSTIEQAYRLIEQYDDEFKPLLDAYKYPQRTPHQDPILARQQSFPYLARLNQQLKSQHFLFGKQACIADIAIFPFIRQFYMVDCDWFKNSQFEQLTKWLITWLNNDIFHKIMLKQPPWNAVHKPIYTSRQ